MALLMTLSAIALVAVPQAKQARDDFTRMSASEFVDFRYSFPTIVGSYPKLLATMHADRSERFEEALSNARDDAEIRRPENFPFHQHQFWRDWLVTGQTDRLVALRSQTETFTGGAHGMHSTGLLLWDKEKNRASEFAELFASASGYWPILEMPFCAALAAERLRRVDMKNGECPKRKELVLVPADTNSDWMFDTIKVVADPYVAGAYAEGRYEIALPVTSALIAALKPEYRSSFEAQRPQ